VINNKNMKKINLVLIMVILLSTVSISDNYVSANPSTSVEQFEGYCRGFDLGFQYGWRSVKGEMSMPPMSPPCPIPEIGRTSELDGYNRGFVVGRRAAARD
jgi:hypothetical protein